MKKKIFWAIFAAIIIGAPIYSLLAADYLPKDKNSGGNVVVGGSEEFKNLYAAGGSVAINKQILGDLFAAGGSINVAGPVEKDLFAAGGNIVIGSPIGEDARITGGNITVNSNINGDLLAAGGTINISGGSQISGDLWIAGGIINLNSPVSGNAKIAGGEILINAPIAGTLEVRADEKLVFGPESQVTGTIKYFGRNEAVILDGAQVGQIDFTRVAVKKFPAKAAFGVFLFFKIIALFIAGLIVLKLFKRTSAAIVSSASNNFWASLGIGFLGLLVVPIAAILLMATIIGAYAGIVLVAWFVFAVLMGGIFTIFFIGMLLEKWLLKKKENELTWRTILWGVLIGAIISIIPIIGWLATLVIFMSVFGGMLTMLKTRIEK